MVRLDVRQHNTARPPTMLNAHTSHQPPMGRPVFIDTMRLINWIARTNRRIFDPSIPAPNKESVNSFVRVKDAWNDK